MKLQLQRRFLGANYTIGSLLIDGVKFCDTLEDTVRPVKIKHETAIAYGTYNVILNRSPKFKRDLPRLLDVPNFDGILIHRGNTAKDSSGCILLGNNTVKGKVLNSTQYELELTKRIRVAQDKREPITIEIV